MLKVQNLSISVKEKPILEGISFEIKKGEITTLTGKNGAGKSSICNAIMGLPDYNITKGKISFCGQDISKLSIDERAKLGLFLSFQNPIEIEGLSVSTFLKYAINNLRVARGQTQLTAPEFFKLVYPILEYAGLDKSFLSRDLNHNFSGGEKKKSELMQILLFEPKFVMLDEIDAGADTATKQKIVETIKVLNG
ncbi:MAG: ATP-binding cassette domain-containing protein, partial [Rickettsiales bacterium]|nr:ATP-binding cassette domain-containing protein [Rickettsiales bacterium]